MLLPKSASVLNVHTATLAHNSVASSVPERQLDEEFAAWRVGCLLLSRQALSSPGIAVLLTPLATAAAAAGQAPVHPAAL